MSDTATSSKAGAMADSVTHRILEAGGIQIDRLPMLPVIFDRVASASAEQMRALSPSPMYFSMAGIEQTRVGEFLENYEANAVAAIIDVPEWDTEVVLGFDRDFIFTMVEAIFGGDGKEPPEESGRTFSNIEMRVCARVAELVCGILKQAFGIVTNATFTLERLETRMHFAVIGRRSAQVMAATFLVQAIARGGEMFLLIPHAGLTPIRRALSAVQGNETGQRDPQWSQQMQAGVTRAEITLQAILDEKTMTLDEIARLRPGSVIPLSATPKAPIKLQANDQPLFWCQLGQAEGAYRLRINAVVDPEQEFIGDILRN